LEYLDAYNKFY